MYLGEILFNLEENLFSNVGRKIKRMAKIFFLIFVLICIINFFISINSRDDEVVAIGVFMLFLGPFISWLLSLSIYAFGELVENVSKLANKNE